MSKHPLTIIPGIGKSLAHDLTRMGIESVEDLKGKNPNTLYRGFEQLEGAHVDPCVLYTWRCAIYYAEGGRESELLKWWNWKNILHPNELKHD